MATPGARNRLIAELRRIGPRCTDAADYLGIAIHYVHELPIVKVNADGSVERATHALDFFERRVIGRFDSEWSVWLGLAHFLAVFLDIDVDIYVCMEAAAVMCRRSGLVSVREIA